MKDNALRFVRHLRQRGAVTIKVLLDNVVQNDDQSEAELVEALTCTDDPVTVVCRAGDGSRLGACLWVSCNEGDEAIADWGINPWADETFGSYLSR